MHYEYTKVVHIIAVLIWVGGMLVNAIALRMVAADRYSLSKAALAQLHRWDRSLFNGAQGIVWIAGIAMIFFGGWFPDIWLIAKLVFVAGLAALHGTQSATLRKLANGQSADGRLGLVKDSVIFIGVLITLIVPLVVLKPF